ncbi:MAG: diguanylate cyclase domain-containing protein, partial [Pseudomonadota bacterium]
ARYIGSWLSTYFHHDVVAIVGGSDQIEYTSFRAAPDQLAADLRKSLDILRGRLNALPSHASEGLPGQNPLRSGQRLALVRHFLGRPAIVAAVPLGADADLKSGSAGAPIVFSVKYIDADMLKAIGRSLQISGLHMIGAAVPAGGDAVTELADASGNVIARFAFKPTRPGREAAISAIPFIAGAAAGFALLIGLMMRYVRRTRAAIAAGQSQLRHLATHDPVCGLPNRIYFGERLERVISEVRGGGPSAAVFYIDLDYFKDVNDTLGHHIGDELILHVTQRLSRIMRGDDLAARLGGDEFAIITSCASDCYSLHAIAGHIISAVCAPYSISGHNIIIGVSIGIAVIDRRARNAADILRYADMALYRAKNEGRGTHHFFQPEMDAQMQARHALELDLR